MLTRLIGLTLKNACQLGFRRFSTEKKNGIISSFNSMLSGIGSRFRSISKIVSKQVSTLEALEKLNTEEYSGLRENLRNLKE